MEFKKKEVNFPSVTHIIDEFYPLQKNKKYVYGVDIELHPSLDIYFAKGDDITPLSVHNNLIKFKGKSCWVKEDILNDVTLTFAIEQKTNITKEIGVKDITNKVSYSEIDSHFLYEMAKRLNSNKVTYGGKYELFNWQRDHNIPDLIDALERHLCDLKLLAQGKEAIHNTSETIQQHLAGIAINAQFIHYAITKS